MTAAVARNGPPGRPGIRACTLVWIDAREAIVVGWRDVRAEVERLVSDVPAHHRATGHVRHDPATRHGGGGPPQSAGEPNRLEHLERFVDEVAGRVPVDEDLIILGPGTVGERLRRHVCDADDRLGRARSVRVERASRLTERQLVARLRHVVDADPPRRAVG